MSVSAVFSSHVLEHLFFDEVERLIVEIYRLLVPGGICRVVIPDLEKIVRLFKKEDPRPFLNAMYEIGRRSDVKNAHHCGFTGTSLVRLFGEAGFSRSYVTEFRKGLCPESKSSTIAHKSPFSLRPSSDSPRFDTLAWQLPRRH
jgi:Methyltransferase domain